ncbi:hypothetical protein [Treponema primitia]|uniref:hypothetical protein n=1 Tax=Treponema primitia TaxID=88058 RepID=UPI0002EC8CF6|nr:hypothetical protein [Treponema primitia]
MPDYRHLLYAGDSAPAIHTPKQYYCASVLVFPCHHSRVHCCPFVSPVRAQALPPPSLSSYGNYYTLKRYFHRRTTAQQWASQVVATHAIGPGGQLSMF